MIVSWLQNFRDFKQHRKFSIALLVLAATFVAGFLLFFPRPLGRTFLKPEPIYEAAGKNKHLEVSRFQNETRMTASRHEGAQGIGIKSIDELRAHAIKVFNVSEASRSKLLHEHSAGGTVGFLLGVEPPDVEEIAQMRAFVAELQNESKHLKKRDQEEFDQWLGELIDEYDPFGVTGKKVAFIRIPDDPKGRTSANVYNTDNFATETRRFQGLESDKFQMQSPRIYFTDPGEPLERFKELIKYPER